MNSQKVLILTHSTGKNLYNEGDVSGWFDQYNKKNNTNVSIERLDFPTSRFYGWKNYPFDYWNIWVNHHGYRFQPSLNKLTKKNDLVVWKHCFPGSKIESDPASPSVEDERRSLAVYKLQYNELKKEMHNYPDTKFLVWTLAVMREVDLTVDQAKRTKAFVEWVKNEWDEPGDNIYIWDFYGHQTTSIDSKDQSLYLRPEYATKDAHPNSAFNRATAAFFCERIIEVLHTKE